MRAIFQGRRCFVVSRTSGHVWIQPALDSGDATRRQIPDTHRDLILEPTEEDLDLAEAFERGEIGAFEYPDGHTYPAGREIPRRE